MQHYEEATLQVAGKIFGALDCVLAMGMSTFARYKITGLEGHVAVWGGGTREERNSGSRRHSNFPVKYS